MQLFSLSNFIKSKFSIYIQLHSVVQISNIFFISSTGVIHTFKFIISVQNKEQYSSNISLYELLLYLLFITFIILALFSLKQLLLNKKILSVSGESNNLLLYLFNCFIW